MNKFIQIIAIFATISIIVSGCSIGPAPAGSAEATPSNTATYQIVLGKLLIDREVIDFIANNHCSPAGQFELCQEAGLAFWIDAGQMVKKVYLYAGDADEFRRYKDKLPCGLSFYDPMWKVQEKLRDLNTDETSQPAMAAGLPDEESSPDHMHYWAVYKRLGITVIYDTAFADEDAYIYAVVVNA